MMPVASLALLLAAPACKKATPAADPEFSDAVIFLLNSFDSPEAHVAFAMRDVEDQLNSSMDLESNNPADRALAPAKLTDADVVGMERSNGGRDLSAALPVSVAALSPYAPDVHTSVQMLVDHTPVEPYSPNFYVREFLAGRDCWPDRSCAEMSTLNDLTKENFLMTVDYNFLKDFRWIDMNLPDPSSLTDGEEAINDGDERWGIVARSWTPESFTGQKGDAHIRQSFTIEVWIPDGGGSLRMITLWSETEFDGISFDDDTVINTTRTGIDRNFEAADDWLAER